MTTWNNQTAPDARLIELLNEQEEHFERATAVIVRMQSDADGGSQLQLAQLQKHLERIRTSTAGVHEASSNYRAAGHPLSPKLMASLKQQEHRLQQFIQQIDQLQSRFQAEKERMLPQLENDVARRTMQKAYQRSMRTG